MTALASALRVVLASAALACVALACAPSSRPTPPPEPAKAAHAPPSSAASPPTPESCAASAAGKPELAHCHWSVGTAHYCGGAPPPPEMQTSWPTCTCNGCDVDADCGPEGKCQSVPAYGCSSAAKVCFQPDDPCYGDGAQCAIGCSHDGSGHGGCHGQEPPRP